MSKNNSIQSVCNKCGKRCQNCNTKTKIIPKFYKQYMIANYFKIKKLKKLKVNSFYIRCKKDYQRLNEAGKQKFENFSIYKNEWQIFNNVYNWNYSSGRSLMLFGVMGFHQNARWCGYHTTDYSSWQYMATQMELCE